MDATSEDSKEEVTHNRNASTVSQYWTLLSLEIRLGRLT